MLPVFLSVIFHFVTDNTHTNQPLGIPFAMFIFKSFIVNLSFPPFLPRVAKIFCFSFFFSFLGGETPTKSGHKVGDEHPTNRVGPK